ncbi:hypothetical protein JR316_0007795 [Psilocybe cubensis]|uniref:Uncharacterized protein n=2 Tax=Psilocybe cubensis TaxID=181762 RepID=A0ACB8GW07_PSICU|nr:hypothetical protein JR316_0007795 [Psilocybe cubensis]KAH9479209.1 hypothetical protein JR316_0007795 [Psilocybe cubensis]
MSHSNTNVNNNLDNTPRVLCSQQRVDTNRSMHASPIMDETADYAGTPEDELEEFFTGSARTETQMSQADKVMREPSPQPPQTEHEPATPPKKVWRTIQIPFKRRPNTPPGTTPADFPPLPPPSSSNMVPTARAPAIGRSQAKAPAPKAGETDNRKRQRAADPTDNQPAKRASRDHPPPPPPREPHIPTHTGGVLPSVTLELPPHPPIPNPFRDKPQSERHISPDDHDSEGDDDDDALSYLSMYSEALTDQAYGEVKGLHPTPEDGYDVVQGVTLDIITANLDPKVLEDWKRVITRGGTCYAVPVGGIPEGDAPDIADAVNTCLNKAFPHNPNINVAPGIYISTNPKLPCPLLISGLERHDRKITEQRVAWSLLPGFTFLTFKTTPFQTHYVMTLGNLNYKATRPSERVIEETIRNHITTNNELKNHLSREMATITSDPEITGSRIQRDMASTVAVHALEVLQPGGKATRVVFRVYVAPICTNNVVMNRIRQLLRQGRYSTPRGAAIPLPDFECSFCMGRDHPTGLCPLGTSRHIHRHPPPTTKPPPRKTTRGEGSSKPKGGGFKATSHKDFKGQVKRR